MKKLIFITGDKGGVGKSFTSRIIADFLIEGNQTVHLFDTDRANATFFRFYPEIVNCIDVENTDDLDELLTKIQENDGIFLVDCAARTLEAIQKWAEEVDLFSIQEELELKISVVFLLGPEKDCVQILNDVVVDLKNRVDYVIVKNEGKGKNFQIFENSKLRTRLLDDLNSKEISLPQLTEKTVLVMDQKNITFKAAQEGGSLQIADRQRVKNYRARVRLILKDAGILDE